MGRWLHLLPLLAGLLAVGWFGSGLRHVGEQDALLRTYRAAQPCRVDESVGDGCYAWTFARVSDVRKAVSDDSATEVTVRFLDGSSARLGLWQPPSSFSGLAAGEVVFVGTVRQGWLMDVRRDADGAVMHGPDYPGFWDAVWVNDAVFGAVIGLPLVLWGLFGLLRRRGTYPLWAVCLVPTTFVPAVIGASVMDDAPHLFTWGAYLPTAVTAAVGLAVGLLLSWAAARWLSARAERRALPTSPGSSPWSSAPR